VKITAKGAGLAGVGCLVALVGGVLGVIAAFGVTCVLLTSGGGEPADAFVWLFTWVFFSLFGIPLGAGAALGLWGYARGRRSKPT
jgi:hypothetical protein